jgi:nucleotide-binding universal stress UspA family protein
MGGMVCYDVLRVAALNPMKTFHRVVVAIDFTKHCRVALKEAVHRAAEDHSEVYAVHAMDEFLMEELKRAQATDRVTIRKEWEQKMIHFIEEAGLRDVLRIKVEVRIGRPFDELMEACRVRQADLLVMGAKGSRSDPNRIGVIAAKCIRHAPVDVLVVREDAVGPFKKVLACVDFSENSAKAVQCALHVAKQDGASVDALFVYQSALAMALDYGGMVAPVVTGADPDAMANWQKDLKAFLEPLHRADHDVALTAVVKERVNIREAILEQATESHANLVVLGTRGKSGLRELFIGTTAEKVIQHATCSILAVKPDAITAVGA